MTQVMLFREATVAPTPAAIAAGLGEAAEVFEVFIKEMQQQQITLMDWRFYRDGQAWLSKGEYKWRTSRGTEKVRPIFWLSIWGGFFKVSFNFKEARRPQLLALPLSAETKTMIQQVPANGQKVKYLPVIFEVTKVEQLSDILLIAQLRKTGI